MGKHRTHHSRPDPSSHHPLHHHDIDPTRDSAGSVEKKRTSPAPLQPLSPTPVGGGVGAPGKSRVDKPGHRAASSHNGTSSSSSSPHSADSQENKVEGMEREGGRERVESLRSLWARPQNKRCADCREAGTDWVSVNLGLFLCVRCAGVHRSLGTHISRVKSITMDAWLPEEVALLQELGNEVGARLFESNMPKTVLRSPIYTDQERSERIRRKYETREYAMHEVQSVLKRVHKKAGYGKYKTNRSSTSNKKWGGRGGGSISLRPGEEEGEEGSPSYRNPAEKDVVNGLPHSRPMNHNHSHKSKAQLKMERMEALKALYGEESSLWASENLENRTSTSSVSSSSQYPGRKGVQEGMPPRTAAAAVAAKEGWEGEEEEEEQCVSCKRDQPGSIHSNSCHPSTSSSNVQRVINERGIFGLINISDYQRDERLQVIFRYFQMDSNESAHPTLLS